MGPAKRLHTMAHDAVGRLREVVAAPATTVYGANGLNQYASVGGSALAYDGRGNLISTGTASFSYDSRNRLISANPGTGPAALAYDPADRLYELSAAGSATRFLYDGDQIIGEYDGSGTLLRRTVQGPGLDEPLVSYDGSGTTNRSWLLADHLGSVIAATNASAVATTINSYDAFGQGAASNVGLFGFAGAPFLAPAGVLHLRARAYHPGLGRFLQADPILHAGGMNLYAYVANNPVNATDSWGLTGDLACKPDEICVTAQRRHRMSEREARQERIRLIELREYVRELQRPGAGEGVDPTANDDLPTTCLGQSCGPELDALRDQQTAQDALTLDLSTLFLPIPKFAISRFLGGRGLRSLTHAQTLRAFRNSGLRPSDHFVSQLLDPRTRALGVRTLNDVRGILRNGVRVPAQQGRTAFVRNGVAVVVARDGTLVTIRPWR